MDSSCSAFFGAGGDPLIGVLLVGLVLAAVLWQRRVAAR